jgi:hypothetical protein
MVTHHRYFFKKQLRFAAVCHANPVTSRHYSSRAASILQQQSTHFMGKRQLIKHTVHCALGCSLATH